MLHLKQIYLACLGSMLLTSSVHALEPIDSREPTFWLGPEEMQRQTAGIGNTINDIGFEHLHGGQGSLHAVAGNKGTVVFVRDPECPVSQRYGPRSAELARWYEKKGFNFLFIYLNNNLGADALLDDAKRLHTNGVLVGKGSFMLADALKVVSTGDSFLLDANKKLVYRGAIDDQYGFGYTKDTPTHNYLRNAMDALLSGRKIDAPATSAPGCVIDADPKKDALFPHIPFDAEVS